MTMTLGLTGFTGGELVAGPELRPAVAAQDPGRASRSKKLVRYLAEDHWSADRGELATARPGLKGSALIEALQVGCQQGRADVRPRHRRLPAPAADRSARSTWRGCEYRNRPRADRPRLLSRRGAVKIAAREPHRRDRPGTDRARWSVEEDKREYRPQMLLADEGQVRKAEMHLRHVPQAGHQGRAVRPPHRSAAGLRRAGGEEGQERRRGERSRPGRSARRDGEGENVVQISLERRAAEGTAGAGPASRCGCKR